MATPGTARAFDRLAGHPQLSAALASLGFTQATPIQAAALTEVREGHHVIATAETGAGKTMVFMLPILARLLSFPAAQALIVAPSQELCQQLAQVAAVLAPTVAVQSFVAKADARLAAGAQLIVSTPRHASKWLSRSDPAASARLQMVAFDEADMLISTFQQDMNTIVASTQPKAVQYIFTAATVSDVHQWVVGDWMRKHFLHAKHVRTPGLHRHTAGLTVRTVQVDVRVLEQAAAASGESPEMAIGMAMEHALASALRIDGDPAEAPADAQGRAQTLVFMNSAEAAEWAADVLGMAYPDVHIGLLHKRLPSADRAAVLADFQAGTLPVLVATDIAARGLDTTGVRHVVQGEPPTDYVAHIHRCGRAARAGAPGVVTMIVPSSDSARVAQILEAGEAGVDDTISRRRAAVAKARRQKRRAAGSSS